MNKLLLCILICTSVNGFAQKNEIITSVGAVPRGTENKIGNTYQLKYERLLTNSLSFQTGLRYHHAMDHRLGIISETSKFIQSTYNSHKFDLTLLAAPINGQRFKFKTGIGFDIGLSEYSMAARGKVEEVQTPKGIVLNEYWQYNIEEPVDCGVHFVFMLNYYLKNNLVFSAQTLYNQVFNEEKYSPDILRVSTISFSAGIGFRF